VAAELLEASADDLVLSGARVHVRGSADIGVELGEIAAACDAVSSRERGDEPGLGAREIYMDPMMNYPYGVALCQLEVDPSTGAVELGRYFVAYEAGRAVNPALLRGQIVGGAVQGIGGALFEELAYDEAGQPRATSFMDYLLPGATETPRDFECLICEDAPTPTNPLGAKGAGESGIMAVGAAIAGAVSDALGSPSAVTRLPLTPEAVRELIEART
jgi:carbon-monoxide dehydrogenase large subunit/6-hydroxypseudooxynicotine dehydrogenase subunit gamma